MTNIPSFKENSITIRNLKLSFQYSEKELPLPKGPFRTDTISCLQGKRCSMDFIFYLSFFVMSDKICMFIEYLQY